MSFPLHISAAVKPAAGGHDHIVKFYDTDAALAHTVSEFIGSALDGDAAIVVATAAHHGAFETALTASGIDVNACVAAGSYLAFDASELLDGFMVGGEPDPARFADTVGPVIERAAAGGRRVRIYGEMVAVLWDGGHVAAAIALEELWNDLAAVHEFVLLCAYPMRAFEDPQSAHAFRRVCAAHTTVVPSDGSALPTGPDACGGAGDEWPRSPAARGQLAIDSEGRLSTMNSVATLMLGWTEDELRGRVVHELIHYRRPDAAGAPQADATAQSVFGGHCVVGTLEDAFVRRDGRILPVVCSATPDLEGGLVIMFSDATDEIDRRRSAELDAVSWVARIRAALDEDRFELYSQPIVALTGGAAREELLLRMITRDGYVISPAAFLPVAERFSLIAEIERWVITQAVRHAAVGRIVHVNLSAASIADPRLLGFIAAQLRAVMVPASNVVFEVIETALTSDATAGDAFSAGVRELGCGLVLDGFGTGFGSLANLKRLPVQALRIDGDFVRDLATNEANQHLVCAMVDIARSFGCETIAEGVEDGQTLDVLRAYGVDYVQGYFVSHPSPQREAPRLLRQDARNQGLADRARLLREQLLEECDARRREAP